MLHYHPESASQLAWDDTQEKGVANRDPTKPLGPSTSNAVSTSITIRPDDEEKFSLLDIVTRDRPGLLTDIVANLKNLNVNVISAEIDTIGNEARDMFYITYHGEALNTSMETLVVNVLQYHLQLAEIDAEESY